MPEREECTAGNPAALSAAGARGVGGDPAQRRGRDRGPDLHHALRHQDGLERDRRHAPDHDADGGRDRPAVADRLACRPAARPWPRTGVWRRSRPSVHGLHPPCSRCHGLRSAPSSSGVACSSASTRSCWSRSAIGSRVPNCRHLRRDGACLGWRCPARADAGRPRHGLEPDPGPDRPDRPRLRRLRAPLLAVRRTA